MHLRRGVVTASNEALLRNPQNKYAVMPEKLRISTDHTRDFLDPIRQRRRAICEGETALRSDTLCQLGLAWPVFVQCRSPISSKTSLSQKA